MALESGQIIDSKYRVGRIIGEGGMGAVYEGEHIRIARRVAIKVLRSEAAGKPELVARFQREARAAAAIGSKHICDVLDLGDLPNGDAYLVMEFLEGQDLEARFKDRGKIAAIDISMITFQLLEGLATMHEAGIIHRDLKPANVFLARSGRTETVKILDFGVSKFLLKAGDANMTATGAVMGTPLFMSPEQARGAKELDGRSDIYSVGVILYRALTGVLPFHGDNFNELLFKIALESPKQIEELEPEVDLDFAQIVHTAMAREPADRFQTAREFQDAVRAWAAMRGMQLDNVNSIPPIGSVPPPPMDHIPSIRIPDIEPEPGLTEGTTATAWENREQFAPHEEPYVEERPSETELMELRPKPIKLTDSLARANAKSQKRTATIVGVAVAALVVAVGGTVAYKMARPSEIVATAPSASVAPPKVEDAVPAAPPPVSVASANTAPSARPNALNRAGLPVGMPLLGAPPTSGALSASPALAASAAKNTAPPASASGSAKANAPAASASAAASSAAPKSDWGVIAPSLPVVAPKPVDPPAPPTP